MDENASNETDYLKYGQESESALFGFLWNPRHEQFSKAFLGVLKLNNRYET
jgi:hypothetical protein